MNPYRYEIKFILDQADLTRALTWLHTQTTAHSTYPARTVNSVYLDDPGYSSVRDNLAGVADRRKIRLRWYHDENREKPNTTKLEVKYRKGRLGHKDTYLLKGLEKKLLYLEYRDLVEEIQRHLGGHEVFLIDDHLSPTIHISYRREYFEDLNGVRFTFDTPITFHDTAPHSRIFQNTEISYPYTIMEIKFPPGKKDNVSRSLKRLNLTPKRHSKYLVGLAAFGQAVYY